MGVVPPAVESDASRPASDPPLPPEQEESLTSVATVGVLGGIEPPAGELAGSRFRLFRCC